MITKEEITTLLTQLKLYLDNPITSISKRVGISRTTVSRFFNHHSVKSSTARQIVEAGFKMVHEGEQILLTIKNNHLKEN